MVGVIVPASVPARQVEIPDGIERSCEGALYFRPGTHVELTAAELGYVRTQHPEWAKPLIELKPTATLEHHLARRERARTQLAESKAPVSVVHPKIATKP